MLIKYILFILSYNLFFSSIAMLVVIFIFGVLYFYGKKEQLKFRVRATVVDHMHTGYIYLNLNEEIIDINDSVLKMIHLNKEQVNGRSIASLNNPLFQFIHQLSLTNIGSQPAIYTHKTKLLHTYYLIKVNNTYDSNRYKTGTSILITDVTELQYTLNQLEYIGNHDDLTGAYNRYYFQQQMEQLEQSQSVPVAIIVGDVNGLKFVNDTYGHTVGDSLLVEAAEQLFRVFPKNTSVCRIGGDEFAIIIPSVNEASLQQQIKQLESYPFHHITTDYPIGLSLDYAIKKDTSKTLTQIFNEADANMYLKKTMIGSSTRDNNIQLLQKILSGKSIETSAHLNRTAHLAKKFAFELELDNTQTNDLILLSQLHDIGKTIIPDEILFKRNQLTDEEWLVMKTHCLKGLEIVQCSPSLKGVGKYILHHHEHYNGKGYPHQLRGDEIPFLSRIISIIDSYDAMTSKRCYKEALSKDDAIKELERCKGTQFDPDLCQKFIRMVS